MIFLWNQYRKIIFFFHRDTIADEGSKSWHPRSRNDVNYKRSDEKAAEKKTLDEIQNLDFLIKIAVQKFGMDTVCHQPAWKELMNFNSFLREVLESENPHVKLPKQISC